ncbi:MAG: chemotaxis protein CheW [Acidobacteria bacterium]|nr:chemotaxis protein CheW [Acidobacteriota bacterium]
MSPRHPPRRGRPAAAGNGQDGKAPNAGGKAPDAAALDREAPDARRALRLPSSGLAREILEEVEQQERQRQPAAAPPAPAAAAPDAPAAAAPGTPLAPAVPPAPAPPLGPGRIFSFAESLERRAAAAPAVAPERPESWVTFELAGERYALPVARIQEITRAHGITRVPHAPQPVRGITNLRGRVLVVVDLRLRLGLPPAAAGERSRILVVSARERSLGLLVDAAHQVVGLLPSRIEPPPPDLMDERSAYLAGVVQLDDSLVIVLDVDQLLLVPEDEETPSQSEAGGPP